ncbi:MAG: toxin-antitoxin system HicB family antitoxin [Phycisphaera sp.]|nr:toxin-antitoxin system HicB family antitoxin [Phycisphaera sp.]
MLEHKGYIGTAEVDTDAGILFGTVQGINDVIHYEARTVDELKKAFRDSVEDYLEMCQDSGVEPEKPYSGKFQARIGEELHRKVSAVAAAKGVSLNDFVKQALMKELPSAGKIGPVTKTKPKSKAG